MLYKLHCKTISVFLILLTLSFSVIASDLPELGKMVREDTFLSSGQLGIVTLGPQTYLVSVGLGQAASQTVDAQIKARKVARLNALSRLTKFIHGSQMTVEEQFTSVREISRDGSSPPTLQQRTSWQSTLREQGAGLLQNLLDVANWNSPDGMIYYQALALLLPEQ
ncbi:MAG: hypothetical protein IPL99_08375 [Candidatus Competibacteraceae bacterium]|nr:hypothetical protein [Candidatus Competibacteraceae bacterium]